MEEKSKSHKQFITNVDFKQHRKADHLFQLLIDVKHKKPLFGVVCDRKPTTINLSAMCQSENVHNVTITASGFE